MKNSIRINARTIKSDGAATVLTNNLEVSFQNTDDATAFQEMISELNIGDSPQDQLYLLEAMSYAGVGYTVQ